MPIFRNPGVFAAASPISTLIQGKLISANKSPFAFPANAPAASIRYYAIYYSAQWCPPCHAFTPVLVEWYKKFKPSHPNFELIFVSEDRDEAAMIEYMKEMAMPWPAMRFGDLKHDGGFKGSGIEKFAGTGIPDLVLVDADGKVLSDSFSWTGSYLGPQRVLDDIEKLVGPGVPAPPAQPAAPAPAIAPVVSKPPPPPLAAPAKPSPAPVTSADSAPEAPSSSIPFKPWAPLDVMPSQPNWTWETLDGMTYHNVVVTKIESDTVAIIHSMGVAHIPIATLPREIQKRLNYDPAAAAATLAENKRELAHPYYTMASLKEAQRAARQLDWPLAWMCGNLAALSTANPQAGSEDDLTRMALNHLKSQAVIIFLDGNADLPALSPIIRDQQFFQYDDGPVPDGHHFYSPKIVFSDANVTKAFGRVSFTQMKAYGAAAIDGVLAAIPKDPIAPSTSNGQIASAPAGPAPSPIAAPSPAPAAAVTPAASAPAAQSSPDTVKPWAPTDMLPSQPNWTWETLDGRTYQNVVVTKIEPDTIAITHSLGVAHIPINLLPSDIRKKLNYVPHAASQAAP